MTLHRIRTQRRPHSPKGTRERYATLGGGGGGVPFQTLVQRGGNAGEQSLAGVGGGRGAVVSLDVWTEEGETSEGRADVMRWTASYVSMNQCSSQRVVLPRS